MKCKRCGENKWIEEGITYETELLGRNVYRKFLICFHCREKSYYLMVEGLE